MLYNLFIFFRTKIILTNVNEILYLKCYYYGIASEEVREEYEEMLKELSPELCAILDRIEEAWYLMKEAELQATYMQGISDGMDMQKEKLRRVC